jgi:hypothetical protein
MHEVGYLYQGEPFIHKNAFGCTGQPIIPSKTKTKKMAKNSIIWRNIAIEIAYLTVFTLIYIKMYIPITNE